MKVTKGHKIFSSFVEWFEHVMLTELEAFKNISTNLYEFNDTKLNFKTFQSPYTQWVYDQSVSGANIPTSSGLGVDIIDYKNGRIIDDVGVSGQINIAIKDFNIYTTTKTDAEIAHMIVYNQVNSNPNPANILPNKPKDPYNFYSPCIFLKPEQINSSEFAFGGMVEREFLFVAGIVSLREFDLYGIADHFQNKQGSIFYYFDDTSTLNNRGDYPNGKPYNYKNKVLEINQKSNKHDYHVTIEDVVYIPLEIEALSKPDPNIYYGRLSFHCKYYEYANRKII